MAGTIVTHFKQRITSEHNAYFFPQFLARCELIEGTLCMIPDLIHQTNPSKDKIEIRKITGENKLLDGQPSMQNLLGIFVFKAK